MYIHKDIIIIVAFFLIVIFTLAVFFIFDLKTFLNNLKSFPKKKITSHDQFFYRFFEPFIFNLSSIIENYENKLKEARLRIFFFDYFFKNFPDPLLIINGRNEILEYNISAHNLINEDAKGKKVYSLLRIPELTVFIDKVRKTKKSINSEVKLIYPEEKNFNVWISGNRALKNDFLNFIRLYDSTYEHNLQKIQRDFIANASHELKTPISSILSYCETLLDENKEKDDIKTKFLKTMFSESKRMSLLVQDLLSLSRVERTEYIPPTSKINITTIANDIKKIFYRKKNSKTKISFVLPQKDIFLVADLIEIKQVFINLIENSLNHSFSKKPIVVSLSNTKDFIDFSVKDFGIGIAQKDIPLLTKRFYRVDSARSRESGNTGLGLSIVKHIINRHKGRLIIESELGLGSCFTARLNK